MRWSKVFVGAVCVLELGAGIAYVAQGQVKLGVVWLFVGLANVAMFSLDGAS